MSQITPVKVFTPNDYPQYTYVDRIVSPPLEQQLRHALETPKEVISISGPSKSGKSVLIERVVGVDNLIIVSGSQIDSTDSLWERVLDWMGAPSSASSNIGSASLSGKSSTLEGGVGVPMGIAKGSLSAGTRSSETNSTGSAKNYNRSGLTQVEKEIGGSPYCVLIDDFHYIATDLQVSIGKQIKTASEKKIRIIAAAVPHRSDDVVRSNAELRGRTKNIDTEFWKDSELCEIANLGFHELNMHLSVSLIQDIARNACGSPQLMQRICLNICQSLGVTSKYLVSRYVADNEIDLRSVLAVTSTSTDYKSLLQTLHGGPKTRGQERKPFNFKDGSRGDVYRAILLAVKLDPPKMELPYPELMDRIKAICIDETPTGRSVSEACGQMSDFAKEDKASDRAIEFDIDTEIEVFHVADPYWLFYLRCSDKMQTLAKEWHDPAMRP